MHRPRWAEFPYTDRVLLSARSGHADPCEARFAVEFALEACEMASIIAWESSFPIKRAKIWDQILYIAVNVLVARHIRDPRLPNPIAQFCRLN